MDSHEKKQGGQPVGGEGLKCPLVPNPFHLDRALQHFEQGFLQNVLQLAQGDLLTAARMLEISPQQLTIKVRRYGLQQDG